jgi:4-diphosphocytidyl-2C-methyl-D-erythritol kinase
MTADVGMVREIRCAVPVWRFSRYPKIATTLDWLAQCAPSPLTGTGSCIFAAFKDPQGTRDVRLKILKALERVFALEPAVGHRPGPA